MATPVTLKKILMTITVGSTTVDFVLKGNADSYANVAAVTNAGFTAAEATETDLAKTLGVITPITALLESGSFKRIKARAKTGKGSREVVIPSSSVQVITAAIEASAGLTIGGLLCGSVSQGLRRVAR